MEITSQNTIEDVNLTGKPEWSLNAESGGVGVGGSFNYQNFDTNSLVIVGEGVQMTAGDIAISSDNKIFHVGALMLLALTIMRC